MPLILFLIGIPMVALGRVRFGSFARSGQVVRAAGVLLMLPFAASLLFSGLYWTISGNWTVESRNSFIQLLGWVQLLLQVLAMFCAWWLMRKSPLSDESQPLPMAGFLRQWMERNENVKRATPSPTASREPPARSNPGSSFPSVMNTRQAAAYLQVPEQTILDLITNGELIAARINHRYTIARSVLDEYRNNQASDR
ncbi:MAG: helix-turn-helix domain-containing protein [Chloroflexi bacterium]|nr:helix-turn-helix domain-containing protein [Anaerolineaceae bacterium]MCY4106959.1 helix-turn-helix domain-containing protein [Chloroflexota bacterium]